MAFLAAWALLSAGACMPTGEPEPSRPAAPDSIGEQEVWTPPSPLALDVRPFPALPIDTANPLTREGVDLGKRLFHDPVLSRDSSISCAECHRPGNAFSDSGKAVSFGVHGRVGARNTPALANLAWAPKLFWDGRAASLEEQAFGPVRQFLEMDLPWDQVETRLNADSGYRAAYWRAFGTKRIDSTGLVKALAQYERTLISTRSRYDRWKAADIDFTDEEYQGYEIFNTEAGECFHCHGEPFFTNFGFRNIGLDSAIEGTGLGGRTGKDGDMGTWKVPTLRNLAFTAPYMHDGRFATLEEVIDFYQSGGHYSATLDPLIRNAGNPYAKFPGRQGLGLTVVQKKALLAFLATLNDSDFVMRAAGP
jgi:cytochrome c peroxidase